MEPCGDVGLIASCLSWRSSGEKSGSHVVVSSTENRVSGVTSLVADLSIGMVHLLVGGAVLVHDGCSRLGVDDDHRGLERFGGKPPD